MALMWRNPLRRLGFLLWIPNASCLFHFSYSCAGCVYAVLGVLHGCTQKLDLSQGIILSAGAVILILCQ
jgi:hypothetical protein